MYLLIKPHNNPIMYEGMKNAKWMGCATLLDIGFVINAGYKDKIKVIKYGINPPSPELLLSRDELDVKFGLNPNKDIVLSCGGFWPHKGFKGLAECFRNANPHSLQLVLTGYDWQGYDKSIESENIKQLYLEDLIDVYSFMFHAEQYVMNSTDEGFGLVLLEASFYGVPWLSRAVGGAPDLAEAGLGMLYETDETLMTWIRRFDENMVRLNPATPEELHDYVVEHYDPMVVTENLLSVLN
jgi:glycosyltransferase involved in cell wall biosynthesis